MLTLIFEHRLNEKINGTERTRKNRDFLLLLLLLPQSQYSSFKKTAIIDSERLLFHILAIFKDVTVLIQKKKKRVSTDICSTQILLRKHYDMNFP